MPFLENLANNPPLSSSEAAVAAGAALFTLSGAFGDLERRLLSVFRDEFPALSRATDAAFDQFVARATTLVSTPDTVTPPRQFVQKLLSPAILTPADRLALYRYVYALAMTDLNVDNNEQTLLDAVKAEWSLAPADCKSAEDEVTGTYAPTFRSLAALALGLIVVAADGVVKQEELDDLKSDRTVLAPIARLDDTQFSLIFDIGQSIYSRFLTDANNRRIFLYYMIVPRLDTPDLRTQAFRYAASVCTSDGDVAQSEVDTLKDILTALQMADDAGESIFNEYMTRVKTIDGQPAPSQPH
ncbi:MAG: tellurite resistance TerB family protein [Aggregatilineales bacterium]